MSRMKRKTMPVKQWKDGGRLVKIQKSAPPVEAEPEYTFETIAKSRYVPLAKANVEEKTITGIALQPDVVDAHGDIISAEVIRKAAHQFLANYNKSSQLGVQHKNFKPKFEVYESYIAPVSFVIGQKTVLEGSWVVTVKVHDDTVWKQIKSGKITGFSIGGTAKVKQLKKEVV